MAERDALKRNKSAVLSRVCAFWARAGFLGRAVFFEHADFLGRADGQSAEPSAHDGRDTQTVFSKGTRQPPQKILQSTFGDPQAGRSGQPVRAIRERSDRNAVSSRTGCSKRARRLRRELAVLAGLLLALVLSNFTGFASACAEVREDTLRLHILANSDSEEDQALKLAVRDAILAGAGGLFAAGQTKQEALDAARQSLPLLQAIAQETLRAHGCDDAVSVRLEERYFDTREYEDFTLPAGRYDAVRIEIGAHEGKNWFCVLFPPLCLPAASDEDALGEDAPAYSEAEQNVIHSPYRIRFAAVELFEGWKEAFAQSREGVTK